MDFNGLNSFDDFMKFCESIWPKESNSDEKDKCNYKGGNNDNCCDDCQFGSKNAEASESARNACSDIPGGFQDINPQLFTIVTSIIGTVVAGNLPFNLQNAIGNWLELLGQSIITFNAQQQYFQGGPGRYYDPIYRNAANPFCSNDSDESQKNTAVNNTTTSNMNSKSNNKSNNLYMKEIEELKCCVEVLSKEVQRLNKEIEELKK